MRTEFDKAKKIAALGLLAWTVFLLPGLEARASGASTEGRPGAAFGTDAAEQTDEDTILSDYSDNNVTYGLELTDDQTAVSSSVIYDSAKQRYIYITEQGRVEATVMDGMIVTGAVSVAAENSLPVTMYKDGERLEQSDMTSLTDSGYYVLQYTNKEGIPQTIMEFTIVPSLTGMIDHYALPAGFTVTSASRNGEELPASSQIDMQTEGSYRITYMCQRTGVSYELDVDIDHTPPTLALEAVKDGVARGPVDISDLEPGATVYMTLDGRQYNYREKLTRSGDYEIWVFDAAGNYSKYEFTIMVYLDGSGYAFVGILLLLILGVTVYMTIEKKRLRVR